MTQRLITYLAVALAIGAAWLFWPNPQFMPAATFNLTDGRVLTTADLRGKPLLINFWSVSCEICLRDMPRLRMLQESLADHDFTVIGVAMPHDPPPAIMALTERLKPGYPIALDVHGEINAAFGGVQVTPTSFLIDGDGEIRFSARGALDEARIGATVTTF